MCKLLLLGAALLFIATASAQPLPPPVLPGTATGGQPYFQASLSANQSVTTAVATKVAFNVKTFDSSNAYDNTTNFRFNPQLAGKYRVTVNLEISAGGTSSGTFAALLYKNGAEVARSQSFTGNTNTYANSQGTSKIIAMNGTSDYLEGWGIATGTTTPLIVGGAALSYFEAYYIGP